jgi:hypothetical protein
MALLLLGAGLLGCKLPLAVPLPTANPLGDTTMLVLPERPALPALPALTELSVGDVEFCASKASLKGSLMLLDASLLASWLPHATKKQPDNKIVLRKKAFFSRVWVEIFMVI